ncbi:hypothetical protein GW17_00016872, partial [Ensete ventricosum]
MASSSPLLQAHGGGEKGGAWWRRLIDVEEAKAQLLFAFPMILTNVSYYAITLISVMFAGHLGDVELAGATLGNSWGTVTGLALMLYRMLGLYLQSTVLISTFFSIFVSILWCYSESILIWLHQEPQVARLAAVYLKYLIPGLFAYGSLQCMLRFLQTQTVVVPLVVCSVVPLAIHVALTYVTVHVLGLGFKGTALSGSISLWISFVMLALYVRYSDKFRYTWEGFSAEAFHHVLPCMKLAVPSAVMVCFEYWAFEVLVLLAGLLPNSELSTSLVAMCTRVSNEIGAGNIDKAKNAVAVTMKLAVFLGITIVLVLAFGHDLWARSFSSSHDITRAFAYMTPLLTVSIVLDSAQGVLS